MSTVSSATKFFPTAQEGFTTQLASTISAGAVTVPLNSLSGYSNGDTIVLVVDPTSATAKQAFTGIVDTAGTQLTSVVWTEGSNQSHATGTTVVDYETATHWALYSKGLLVSHDQDGTLAAGAVDNAAALASNVVTTAKILDANVTTAKLATSAVTTAKIKPSTIDFTASSGSNFTTTSSSYVDVTGVTTTYTAGATNERLFVWVAAMFQVSAAANALVTLNAGSDLAPALYNNGSQAVRQSQLYIVDVAANSTTTLKLRAKTDASTLSVDMSDSNFVPTIKGFAVSNV